MKFVDICYIPTYIIYGKIVVERANSVWVRQAEYLPGKRDDEKRAANILYYARVFAWKWIDEGPFMPVRAPLIVKNSQEKVGGKERRTLESSGFPGPLLTRSFRLDILAFFFFFLPPRIPRQPLCRDFRIARKVSYIRVVIEPAFFLRRL